MILRVACPAKLNLFLAVGPADATGYHPIRSIFQAIGLYDEVLIDLEADETTVTFEGADIPEKNTVTKALRLMAEFTDLPKMGIQIVKRIPSEAGLGGGSSNAAAVIRAVRKLVPERFSERDAFSVAQAVGADVPFFLVGGRTKAEGYGEILTPLTDDWPLGWALVVKPPYSHATAEMYAQLDALSYPFEEFPQDDRQYNDFERVACDTTDLAERLGVFGGRHAGMTGSGSAVYGLFPSEDEAQQAEIKAKDENLGAAWIAPLLTRQESLRIDSLDR
jgi:4-diphosphocytidyl-2-C-methyl-D-erythritol kinase